MNKNQIQAFYEEVYSEYSFFDVEQFDSYERNHILRQIYQQQLGKKILDIGAGAGLVSKFFQKNGYETHALEWTEAGAKNLKKMGIYALQKDVKNIPYDYDDNTFDEVFWGDNIEHLFFPEYVAREIHRILKPGGRLVLSTPNHGWIINRLYYLFMGVPRRTEGQRLPIWQWQHIRYFNQREIRQFLAHCGFNKNCAIHGAERRQPFAFLSRFFPALFGSVMIIEIRK